MRKPKLLLLLMACLLILLAFAGCQNGDKNSDGKDTTETQAPVDEPSTVDKNGYLLDSLPESYDFDSKFVIFTWDGQDEWEWCEELPEEATTVDEVLWKRQVNVEERFGVSIELVRAKGDWDRRTSFINTLSSRVLVGDKAYDLVGQYTPAAGIGAVNGLYKDLNTSKYLDLEKPWWPSSISETATVGEKLYFVTGDITPTLIMNINASYVNLDMWESYQLSDVVDGRTIFDLVDNYDWTMEMMLQLALNRVSIDLGDYGVAIKNEVSGDAFLYGGGFTMVENTNGIMTLSKDLSSQYLLDYFDDVKELMTGRYEDIKITGSDPFTKEKAIFYIGDVQVAKTFATEGVNFSVLPMPMMDKENRQEYTTNANLWVSMYSIPVDVSSFDMSSIILEALGSEAYRTVSDEIYYNLFQRRYNGANADTARMFDVVSDSVVFDAARFFADDLDMFAEFRLGVCNPAGNWSTIYSGNKEAWIKLAEDLYGKIG